MRTLLLSLISLLMMTAFASAQDEETLFEDEVQHGGYGAGVVKFTRVDGDFAVLAGGEFGWIINHLLVLGGAGYGLATEHDRGYGEGGYYHPLTRSPLRLNMGYGGPQLGVILHSSRMIHATGTLLIGAGSVSLSDFRNEVDNELHDISMGTTDSFFIIEPEAGGELNLTRWMRARFGLSYRFVSGIERLGLENGDIGGISGNLAFKFGKF